MLKVLAAALATGFRVINSTLRPAVNLTARCFYEVVRFNSGRRVAVGKLLAEGGFSFVYTASDLGSRQQYALKKIICQDSDAKAAARAEARMHDRFRHENLLPLVDSAFNAHPSSPNWDICWMLFPLCSCSLRDEITRQVVFQEFGPCWTLSSILAVLDGICRGLQEMHRVGVAHRDLKPENVLLENKSSECQGLGRPVLMDFGSCGEVEVSVKGRREAIRETEAAAQLCTMQYRAPELFDVPSDIQVLSYGLADVWSFGCTSYCCLMGYSPFEVEFEPQSPCRPRQVDTTHLRILGSIPWPKSGPNSGTPDWFKELLRWVLMVDPKQRPNIGRVLDRLVSCPRAEGGRGISNAI
mmetsp:Transcript_32316/g.89262  ORF Transcript_32316/g.89262 Transcript_32316/m.89262 type:complete len:355 (-) Transcript_32316:20-1084(-)